MQQNLFNNAGFLCFLFSVDQDLAEQARQKNCSCGGRLHRADYPRKPRGVDRNLSPELKFRFSFCCNCDGCRKRQTPPSVRFLGRKVYLFAVVVLVSAMRQGPSPRRVHALSELFDADRRTIARWQLLWREIFPQTQFWKGARGFLLLMTPTILPLALLENFLRGDRDDPLDGWGNLLRFLSPITITGALSNRVS